MYENDNNVARQFWLNDIDTEIINLLQRLKDNPQKLLNELKKELSKYKTDSELTGDKNKSRALLLTCHINGNLCRIQRGYSKIENYEAKITEYKKFFDKVTFYNMDAINMLVAKKQKILIYFDPPYFNSHNKYYQDNTEEEDGYHDGTKIYSEIYDLFNSDLKDKVLIFTLNKIHLINKFFDKWNYMEYDGLYGSGSIKKHIVYVK